MDHAKSIHLSDYAIGLIRVGARENTRQEKGYDTIVVTRCGTAGAMGFLTVFPEGGYDQLQ